MKKDYNQFTKSDMPLETSLQESTPKTTKSSAPKSKINVIGANKKPRTTTGSTKSSSTKKTTTDTKKTVETVTEPNKKKVNEKLREKLSSNAPDLQDLEKLNEENLKKFSFRARRNRVLIIVLAIALGMAIVSVVTFSMMSRLENNCFLHVQGDAAATYIIDGKEMDKFRTPSNLQGNRILQFNADIRIESGGEYYVKFKIDCYQNDTLMQNTLVYEPNLELFELNNDGYYYSFDKISGNQTVRLCQGVSLDLIYENSLDVDSFRMEMFVIFEKV